MPVGLALQQQALVATALAVVVVAAVRALAAVAAAAVAVLAFMDKGATAPAKLTQPGVTAAAVAAMRQMAIIIAAAVTLAVLGPLAAPGENTEAAAEMDASMAVGLKEASASFGPASHGHFRLH